MAQLNPPPPPPPLVGQLKTMKVSQRNTLGPATNDTLLLQQTLAHEAMKTVLAGRSLVSDWEFPMSNY